MPSTTLDGGTPAPERADGRDVDRLGPSDSSDSGSDVQGERRMPTAPDQPDELGAVPVDTASGSDALGTGERASATGDDPLDGADILPDRIVEAGSDGAAGSGPRAADDADAAIETRADDDADIEGLVDDRRLGRPL